MNRLHNCPNCGGYLNDHGRCEFCGSKVYDFCDIDLAFDVTQPTKLTYIRMKTKDGIWTVPVYAQCCDISYKPETCPSETFGYPYHYMRTFTYPEIDLHFIATGEGVYEKEDNNE
jgi:hypothetical protein